MLLVDKLSMETPIAVNMVKSITESLGKDGANRLLGSSWVINGE